MARQVQTLDTGWRFVRADVPDAGAAAFDDSGWVRVALPHTWNAVDGEAGGPYYRGVGWYRRELVLPASSADLRQFLQFDGAALVADVWVNGALAGRHEGGFAAFRLEVTSWLRPGRNVIAVRVDNAPQPSVAPLGGDFTVFGGLYRGVSLISVPGSHIDLLDDGGPGLYVSTIAATPALASLQAQVRVRAGMPEARHLRLRLSLLDARGRLVLRSEQAVAVVPGAVRTVSQSLPLRRPQLWQGPARPYLYTLRADLLEGDVRRDRVQTKLGIRTFQMDPDRGLLLNGKPQTVRGVNLFHSGRPGQGWAVSAAQIDEDFRQLQALGVSGLRLVHFQHPQRVYDHADRLGLLVWTELALNSAMAETPAFGDNLDQQLRELIKQNFNHPSVITWGLGNEVYRSDPPVVELLGRLHRRARELDPDRPTSYAHCCAADDHPMTLQSDLIGFNRYMGWYDRELVDFGPWADGVHAQTTRRPMAISEYGAGASVLHQQDPPQRPVPNGHFHPEQYQALFHEAYWRQIRDRPWLWGSFVWVGFDLPSAGRDEGDRAGVNNKGLITYDRRIRKDAYYWYQANWSRQPMVHLTSRRHSPRSTSTVDVKVYSNGRTVKLEVNGVRWPARQVQDHVAVWPGVPLVPGRNRLRVSTDHGAMDRIDWMHTP